MKERASFYTEKRIFFVLVVLAGVGLVWVMPASARSDGRRVVIGSNTYKVKHNGNGPYVKVKGEKYYLGGEGKKIM